MCLIFFSINRHPTYKLVIAANRDEFYNRKTAAAGFWEDHPHVLGGRDLEAYGTWMGITRGGKISMLTNYRDLRTLKPDAPSRGHLVADYLIKPVHPETYLAGIVPYAQQYNGFNLLVGDSDSLWYYSNFGDGIRQLTSGVFGLSNHLLDTPWPKVARGKTKFEMLLQQLTVHPNDLFNLLYDDQRADFAVLPDTGLPPEREHALSSMFIKTDGYGSRCSTVVLVDHNGHVLFSERIYNWETFEFTTSTFEFDIEPVQSGSQSLTAS
jgi:uncharacterized protein with NRDE domain